MKKVYILILAGVLCGCSSQSRPAAPMAVRKRYIENNIAEINKANRRLLVRKSEGLLTWRPSIERLGENKEALMEVIIRAMCGTNTDILVSELMALAPAGEGAEAAIAELKGGLEALSRAGNPDMCGIFERAILRGNIVEGMTSGQVEAAWGKELIEVWSDSPGNSVHKIEEVEQENYVLKQGKIVIAATTLSMRGHLSDFYLEFKEGKVVDWTFVPHVGGGF